MSTRSQLSCTCAVFLAGSAGLLGLVPGRAWACSYVGCAVAELAPLAGDSVPANVLGLPLQPARSSDTRELPATDAILKAADGRVVPTTTKTIRYELVTSTGSRDDVYANLIPFDAERNQSLVVPEQPLVPGIYSLSIGPDCWAAEGTTQSFTVLPAAPWPAMAGSAEVMVRHQADYRVLTGSGSCSALVDASVATVRFAPAPDLAAFQSVARIEVTVDGIRRAQSDPSEPTEPGQRSWRVSTWGKPLSPIWSTELHTTCVPMSPHDDLGLSEGPHSGQLLVWLAGSSQPLPAVTFAFTTSCEQPPTPDASASSTGGATAKGGNSGNGGAGVGGGTGGAGGSLTISAPSTASGHDDAAASGSGGTNGGSGSLAGSTSVPAAASFAHGGCSCTLGLHTRSTAACAGALLAAVLGRLRRRRKIARR